MARKTYQRLEVELAMKDAMPKRRAEVFVRAASGMSAAEIAAQMGISERTVEWHMDEIKGQLCALNVKDAISQGWMHGLLKAKTAIRACALVLALFSTYQIGPARTVRPVRTTARTAVYMRLVRSEAAA
ncbi:LuxR C-terminal-related transcriptional regulator [Marinobacter sp. JSM 1782161]|uniref:LuxR C-terminal-related transcriptional regulator n=1 Tax=Marinobacter sp. JSM 1782161 TaxID=2685906 RepID=UPI0014023037|nr:LuxR C-terminal-related transcriptional regulator [Marinobacter sp. JSM 1782161]